MLATAAYNNGVAALNAEKWEEASSYFERALALAPDDATSQKLRGYAFLKLGRNGDALAALRLAERAQTQMDATSRSDVQNYIGLALWNNREYSNSLAAYRNALKINARNDEARYNLAFALLARNNSRESIPFFTQLVATTPRDATVHNGLARAYEAIGDWSKAIASHRAAVAIAPREYSYQLALGMALVKSDPNGAIKGRHEAAASALRTATNLKPDEAPAHLQLGQIFINKKRWSDAQTSLQKYVALRPDDFSGQFNLALAFDFAVQFDRALAAYNIAASLQPRSAPVQNNIGRVFFKRENLDEAIARFRAALALDGEFLDARNNLAIALSGKDDKAAATEWQNLLASAARTLRTLPTTSPTPAQSAQRAEISVRVASARAALAEHFMKTNRHAEAVKQYRELVKINPNNAGAHINLGLSLYYLRDYAGALSTFDAVIKRDPKNAVAYNNRGVVLEATKNKDLALTAYKRAIELRADYTDAKNNRDRLLSTTAVS